MWCLGSQHIEHGVSRMPAALSFPADARPQRRLGRDGDPLTEAVARSVSSRGKAMLPNGASPQNEGEFSRPANSICRCDRWGVLIINTPALDYLKSFITFLLCWRISFVISSKRKNFCELNGVAVLCGLSLDQIQTLFGVDDKTFGAWESGDVMVPPVVERSSSRPLPLRHALLFSSHHRPPPK